MKIPKLKRAFDGVKKESFKHFLRRWLIELVVQDMPVCMNFEIHGPVGFKADPEKISFVKNNLFVGGAHFELGNLKQELNYSEIQSGWKFGIEENVK